MTEKKKHWPVVIEEEPCERPSTKEKIPQKTQRFFFYFFLIIFLTSSLPVRGFRGTPHALFPCHSL
jgi:hypothetical protein